MNTYLKVALQAARKAGAYQLKKLYSTRKVMHKGVIDLVTEVDINSEKMICSHIRGKYPDHNVLSEEKVCKTRSSQADDRFLWVIDPLDGTINYIHHIPFFCVSIALVVNGILEVGVVYNPVLKECFTAVRGKGAYLNGKKIHVSGQKKLLHAVLATGFAYNIRKVRDTNFNNFIRVSKRSTSIRRLGSAAIDLAYVACGIFDGFWELYLNPWDTAAGALLVMEAGGQVTGFKSKPFDLYGREIVATNSRIHKSLQQLLR